MDIKNLGTFDAGSRFETDVVIIGSGPAGLTVAREFFQTSTHPHKLIVDTAIRHVPDFAASVNRGEPHKLMCWPNKSPIGKAASLCPTISIAWVFQWRRQIGGSKRMNVGPSFDLLTLCDTLLRQAGLPEPVLEPWVMDDRPEDGVIMDMAHTMGTTRMSDNPQCGVVDRDCRVHNVDGLFIAGSSVFPTGRHANPTLMICTCDPPRRHDQIDSSVTYSRLKQSPSRLRANGSGPNARAGRRAGRTLRR
jgi:choline dehydrogenase-like flavoprotein